MLWNGTFRTKYKQLRYHNTQVENVENEQHIMTKLNIV